MFLPGLLLSGGFQKVYGLGSTHRPSWEISSFPFTSVALQLHTGSTTPWTLSLPGNSPPLHHRLPDLGLQPLFTGLHFLVLRDPALHPRHPIPLLPILASLASVARWLRNFSGVYINIVEFWCLRQSYHVNPDAWLSHSFPLHS